MKLFLSYTSLLGAIARNEVPQEDLDTGLFYFGCDRAHALQPGAAGEHDERTSLKENGSLAHAKLVHALSKAESEGRCSWQRCDVVPPRPVDALRSKVRAAAPVTPYARLNKLLVANGVGALKIPVPFEPYAYPAVRAMMSEVEGPRAEVVF